MNAKAVTLEKLKKAGSKGITVNDCPVGFRLSAVILELRKTYKIVMYKELDYSRGYSRYIGRYVLKGRV